MKRKNDWKTIINSYNCKSIIIKSKKKPIIYTKVFFEIYNWCNYGLVYKIYRIVELEKYPILRVKNLLNLGAY